MGVKQSSYSAEGMERMALLCPPLPTAVFHVSHSFTYLLSQSVNNRGKASHSRSVSVSLYCELKYMNCSGLLCGGLHSVHTEQPCGVRLQRFEVLYLRTHFEVAIVMMF